MRVGDDMDIMNNFKIDGVSFADVGLIKCTEIAEIRQRDDCGYSTVTGTRIQNIIGTFLNYSIVIDFKKYSLAERNNLYELLNSPVEFHSFCLPHNGTWRTFDGWIDNGIQSDLENMTKEQKWGSIAIEIKAKVKYK